MRSRFLPRAARAGCRAWRPRRLALLASPLLAVSLAAAPLLAGGPAQADTAPATTTPAAATTAASPSAAGTQTVTLLTGEQVQVSASGTVVSVSGGASMTYTGANGDTYVIPAAAAPYAGRQLDWSLFDVSAMARDSITGSAQIPVAVTFSAAGAATPPGVTVTTSAGLGAIGYLTPASVPDLAAYLKAQIAADVSAGNPAGTTPLPGIGTISLAAAVPGGTTVTPGYTYNDVQLSTPGLTGLANAVVRVWNTDSFGALSQVYGTDDGIARIAMPAGNYYAVAQFTDFDDQGNLTATRYVSTGFTVSAAGGTDTFVNLPEQLASTQATAATPRPARQLVDTVSWGVQDAGGTVSELQARAAGPAGTTDEYTAGSGLYVAPDAAGPSSGSLRYVVQWDGIQPLSPGRTYPNASESSYSYRYDVAFGWTNQVPAGPYQVKASQLAAVQEHVYADPAWTIPTIDFSDVPIDPVLPELSESAPDDSWLTRAPGNFTDYLGTADGGSWLASAGLGNGTTELTESDDPVRYAGGRTYSLDWGRGPLSPEFGQRTARPQALEQLCDACANDTPDGDYLFTTYDYESDTSQQAGDSNRYGFNDPEYCYVNGVEPSNVVLGTYHACIDEPDFDNGTDSWLPGSVRLGQVNTYQLDLQTTASQYTGPISQAVATTTDLTFKYRYKAAPPKNMTLPAGYECNNQTGPDSCEILPLLNLRYLLSENEWGTSDAAVQTMTLNVGHQTYDGIGSRAPIRSVVVQVSFDGGTTWQRASVTGRGGTYLVSWRNPTSAAGTDPDLKVSATDSIGGSITQEIDSAYAVGPIRH